MRLVKTPSSLKWLMDKKARIDGEIRQLESIFPYRLEESKQQLEAAARRYEALKKSHETNEYLVNERLPRLRKQLEAIKIALGIHAIQVDPEVIPPIRPRTLNRKVPHGAITRDIYLYLSLPESSANTQQIARFLFAKYQLEESEISHQKWTELIRYRLKNLAKQGKVNRIHDSKDGKWSIWTMPHASVAS